MIIPVVEAPAGPWERHEGQRRPRRFAELYEVYEPSQRLRTGSDTVSRPGQHREKEREIEGEREKMSERK